MVSLDHEGICGSQVLSPTELEILHLLAMGRCTKEIALGCGVSTSTISTHRKHICQKLKVHSTAELIAAAVTIATPVRFQHCSCR